MTTAREVGALIVTHMGSVWSMPNGLHEMHAAGLLGSDVVHVHCNTLTDEEWRRVADSGGKVSISPETEINMGMGRPAFGKCEEFGIKPTLSCDVVSLNSGDLLTQMRLGLGIKRWADTEHLNARGINPEAVSTRSLEALEWGTVNGADAIGMGTGWASYCSPSSSRTSSGMRSASVVHQRCFVATRDPSACTQHPKRPSQNDGATGLLRGLGSASRLGPSATQVTIAQQRSPVNVADAT